MNGLMKLRNVLESVGKLLVCRYFRRVISKISVPCLVCLRESDGMQGCRWLRLGNDRFE